MSETDNGCYYARPTVWTRFKYRLFPQPPRPLIANDPRTFLTTEVYVHVDWADWFRLLVHGRARVQVLTYTDVEVKHADSRSVFWVG